MTFRYDGWDVDEASATVTCRYSLDELRFTERIGVGATREWTSTAHDVARLVYLLAGVSYYKARAPKLIDLGDTPVHDADVAFLRSFYIDGLAEFAYRNGVDLRDIELTGGRPQPRQHTDLDDSRVLIPFGGGIDSIVTVETTPAADKLLFILNRPGDRFDAIERPAAVTGLPILRAERELDPQILRSTENGWLNGHVPVTGIISAIAVLTAILDGRGTVVMSNERSASAPTLVENGRPINHQYSKSDAFERDFRKVLPEGVQYFSALRTRSELWVAEQFAALTKYHGAFRSCNRAFHQDPARRATTWCGECDKCCFIDLVLAPFMEADALRRIFEHEPLERADLEPRFRALLGEGTKPFECVGDVEECREAVKLAAARDDRKTNAMLRALV